MCSCFVEFVLVPVKDTCEDINSAVDRAGLVHCSTRRHLANKRKGLRRNQATRWGIMCNNCAELRQGLPAPQSNSTHEVCLAKGATSSRVNGASLRLFAIEIRPNRSKSAHSRADHGTKPNERLQGHPKDFLVVAHR